MRGQMRSDPKHLLDTQADQNIGNGSVIQPQDGPATVIPQANPELRSLNLSTAAGIACYEALRQVGMGT